MARWQPTYDVNDFVQYHPMFAPDKAGRMLLVTKISTMWLGFRRTVRVRAVFADTRVEVSEMAGLFIGPESPLWIDDSPARVVAAPHAEVWRGLPPIDLDKLFGKNA